MNKFRPFLVLVVVAGASGCAVTPWPAYESAVRCHLDGKKAECDRHYKQAMQIDPKLQGIHASYGVHLLQQGRVQEAEKEFAQETKNYPTFATIAVARLATPNPATTMAEALAPPPPPPPGSAVPPAAGTAPAPATLKPAAATVPAPKKVEGAK